MTTVIRVLRYESDDEEWIRGTLSRSIDGSIDAGSGRIIEVMRWVGYGQKV